MRPFAAGCGLSPAAESSTIIAASREDNDSKGGSTALAGLHAIVDPIPLDDPTEPDHAASLMHRALEQIRDDFVETTWDLFWRATVLGHPTDLIANENGVTPAAVRQAKSRVLRRLRKQLGDVS